MYKVIYGGHTFENLSELREENFPNVIVITVPGAINDVPTSGTLQILKDDQIIKEVTITRVKVVIDYLSETTHIFFNY
jgi:hypothetical protein